MRHLINFFSNVVPTLATFDNLDPIMTVIKSFDKQPSIVKIKAKAFNSTFHFRKTSCDEVEKIISNLNIKSLANRKIFPLRSLN